MKHLFIACILSTLALLTACKKGGKEPEVIVCPPPSGNLLTGAWLMSTDNVNMAPGAIIPEYSFSGYAYLYKEGTQSAPIKEEGDFIITMKDMSQPVYTVMLKPKSGTTRTIEVKFVSEKQFSTGILNWHRR